MLGTLCSCCGEYNGLPVPNVRRGRVNFVVILSGRKEFIHFRSYHANGDRTEACLMGGRMKHSDTVITGCLCSGDACMLKCTSVSGRISGYGRRISLLRGRTARSMTTRDTCRGTGRRLGRLRGGHSVGRRDYLSTFGGGLVSVFRSCPSDCRLSLIYGFCRRSGSRVLSSVGRSDL